MKSYAQTELSSPGKQEHGPLVSAVLAYFCSYVLLEFVATLKLSEPASHREFCFFSGLMLISLVGQIAGLTLISFFMAMIRGLWGIRRTRRH